MSQHRPSRSEREAARRADKVRQGEIVLRRPWQRWVFVGGLVVLGLLVVVAPLLF